MYDMLFPCSVFVPVFTSLTLFHRRHEVKSLSVSRMADVSVQIFNCIFVQANISQPFFFLRGGTPTIIVYIPRDNKPLYLVNFFFSFICFYQLLV
jgi:hypothetical protein